MGKNQSASGLTNVIQYSNGNITFVSGSTTLMSISSSGAITTTGVISGSNALSASYALNAGLLNNLGSGEFVATGSFNTFSSSILTYTGSANSRLSCIETVTGSNITRISALEVTSGSNITRLNSIETVTGSNITRLNSIEVVTGSNISRLNSIEIVTGSLYSYTSSLNLKTASFATTGSNNFIGTQTISGSVLQSGSFTTTGTIIAQTINVQTVTSSIVYSSGSNIFGNLLGDSQTFTGSVLVTGSLTIAGGSSATSYSGTTIYGSTVVCSPVGKFTTCLDLGGALTGTSATLSGLLTLSSGAGTKAVWATTRNFGVNRNFQIAVDEYAESAFTITPSTTLGGSSYTTPIFTLAAAGAATFASTIAGTTIYGSTTVCSPVGLFSGCVGIGTICPAQILHISATTPTLFLSDCAATGNGGNVYITAAKSGVGYNNLTMTAYTYNLKGGGNETSYLSINSAGVSCFAGAVCVPTLAASTSIVSSTYYVNSYNSLSSTPSGQMGVLGHNAISCQQVSNTINQMNSGYYGSFIRQYYNEGITFYTRANAGTAGDVLYGTCAVADGGERMRITSTGITCFACQVCAKSLITTVGGLTENFDSTGGGHVNRYFAAKYIPENTTSAFFKITTSGASSTQIQLAGSNSGVGWHSGQIYLASNSAYWGGFIGSGASVSTAGTAAGYISGMFSDGAGGQIYCVTVANNGTGTSSLIWAYITTITYAGYSTSFTQL